MNSTFKLDRLVQGPFQKSPLQSGPLQTGPFQRPASSPLNRASVSPVRNQTAPPDDTVPQSVDTHFDRSNLSDSIEPQDQTDWFTRAEVDPLNRQQSVFETSQPTPEAPTIRAVPQSMVGSSTAEENAPDDHTNTTSVNEPKARAASAHRTEPVDRSAGEEIHRSTISAVRTKDGPSVSISHDESHAGYSQRDPEQSPIEAGIQVRVPSPLSSASVPVVEVDVEKQRAEATVLAQSSSTPSKQSSSPRNTFVSGDHLESRSPNVAVSEASEPRVIAPSLESAKPTSSDRQHPILSSIVPLTMAKQRSQSEGVAAARVPSATVNIRIGQIQIIARGRPTPKTRTVRSRQHQIHPDLPG